MQRLASPLTFTLGATTRGMRAQFPRIGKCAMNKKAEDSVAAVIENFLGDYLAQFHEHRMYRYQDTIEVDGTVKEDSLAKTMVIRVCFAHEKRRAAIPNIFMPEFMRRKGIGKQLISLIYQELRRFGYQLFIIDLVPSFYNRLVRRGAIVWKEGDSVLITDDTNLV